MEKETLLEALCRVNGQQGGTIHQFLPIHPAGNTLRNIMAMEQAFHALTRLSIVFRNRRAFDKLAQQYHVTIQWH